MADFFLFKQLAILGKGLARETERMTPFSEKVPSPLACLGCATLAPVIAFFRGGYESVETKIVAEEEVRKEDAL